MTLTSPQHNVLRRLEGTPSDIDRYATDLKDAARVMRRTVTQLRLISEGTRQIAESVDAVREAAGETHPELSKAATRYSRTGITLTTYARKLETAQGVIHPLIPKIESAHTTVQTKRQEEREAEALVRDHAWQMPWEDEVTDAQKQQALTAQTTARSATETAEGNLETLWGSFDRSFSTWSDAYDKAVNGIEDAFDAADNNDAWGEDLLPVLGWIAVGLAVVALFVTGPIALAIAAIGAVVGLVMLTINLLKFAKGRGNWLDLTMSIIGIIPFARPLIQGMRGGLAGLRGTSALFSSGRTVLRQSVRSTFPRFGYSPMSGGLFSRVGAAGQNTWNFARNTWYGARSWVRSNSLLGQFSMRDFFIDRPIMNAFRGGHNSVTSFSNFLLRNEGTVGNAAAAWARSGAVAGHGPSSLVQWAGRAEFAGTWVANSDFIGSSISERYDSFRGAFAQ